MPSLQTAAVACEVPCCPSFANWWIPRTTTTTTLPCRVAVSRCLAVLLCQAGEICCPSKQQLFYLSQRPYLVTGTLRDQLLYPVPPARVWAASNHADQVHYTQIAGSAPQYSGLDDGE